MQRTALALCVLLLLGACGAGSDTELVAKAKEQIAKRDLPAALIHLKNALDQNPNSTAARALLGRTLLNSGDTATALIELRKALDAKAPEDEVVPDIARALLQSGEFGKLTGEFGDKTLSTPAANAELKVLLASAHAAQGKLELAREATTQALQALPSHAPALVLKARLDASAGDLDGALRQLDAVLAGEANHEAAGLLKADILARARRDLDGAVAVLRPLLAAHPRSVPAHVALATLLLQQGKPADAKQVLEPLAKLAPKHPDTLFLQAQLAFGDKNYKAAREIAEQLLVAAPNNPRVLLLAGSAEFSQRQYTLAAGLFGRAVKAAPQSPVARQLLAQTLLRSGEPDKALEVLQPLLDSPGVDPGSLSLAGEAWLQTGDVKRSEAAFQRALKAAPTDNRLRTAVAVTQLARGDTAPAIAQLEAIARVDSDGRADLALVSARLQQRDLKGALLAIDALEKKQPDRALPWLLRSRVQMQQGDQVGGTASLEKAIALEPGNLPALASLAGLDAAAGRNAAARKRFEDLIKAQPQNINARLALAELDRRLGAPDAVVVTQLEEAVRINPSEPGPQLALIERLLASGDAPAALSAAQGAAAALPNDLALMDALGRTQLSTGDSQSAVSTFKRLAAMQPKNPLHQVRLADAYMAGKDRAAAAAALRQALEIQPGHLMVERGLALLALLDKRPQDAIAIARNLQKRQPKDAVGYALEGELQAGARNWEAAAAAYTTALKQAPTTGLATRLHGSLREGGKAAEAERMANDWQKQHPKDAGFVFYLAELAAAAKDWPGAETRYRAVVALQPRNAVAMNNIAWLMATQKKPGASAMAEQALALLPERASLLDTLALALESEGQIPKAVDAQKRAVELDPRSPTVRLRLAQLYLKQGKKSDAREHLEILSKLGRDFAGQDEVSALLKTL